MTFPTPKNAFFLLVPIVILGTSFFVYSKIHTKSIPTFEGGEYVVELREEGFYPKEITIGKGDTIQFTTIRTKLFWPASNLHPSHTIYPEFDPNEPIDPNNSWSFQFDRVGEWRYHDHLAPYYTGTIIVLDKEQFIGNNSASSEGWEKLILSTFEDKGLDASFDVLSSVYNKEPSFSAYCHDITHRIGEATYFLFAKNEDFTVTPKTAYCSYGFYHGFMGSLLSGTGDLKKTKEFCEYVDKQLADKAPDATLQCYHGIGHGATDITVASDRSMWGNERKMVGPALKICEETASTQAQMSRCATGVYNAIAVFYITNQYQLSMNKDDPLGFCREQPEKYKAECYLSMNTALLTFTGLNFSKAAAYIEDIAKDDHATRAILNLAAPMGTKNINAENHIDQIAACRSLQERLRLPCIQGYAFGFLEHGEPGIEYIKPLNFCGQHALKEDEQMACFEYIFSYLRLWYPREKAYRICETVEEQYRELCRSNL